MMDFMKIIKRQDKQALHEQFMSFPAEGEISFEALPIIKTIDLLSDLIKEVIDCQCGYHQHDNKGEQTEAIRSKLYDKLSPALQDIRVDSNPSFLSTFSRKIFFLVSVRSDLGYLAVTISMHSVTVSTTGHQLHDPLAAEHPTVQ